LRLVLRLLLLLLRCFCSGLPSFLLGGWLGQRLLPDPLLLLLLLHGAAAGAPSPAALPPLPIRGPHGLRHGGQLLGPTQQRGPLLLAQGLPGEAPEHTHLGAQFAGASPLQLLPRVHQQARPLQRQYSALLLTIRIANLRAPRSTPPGGLLAGVPDG
jgi:hypothetical protein